MKNRRSGALRRVRRRVLSTIGTGQHWLSQPRSQPISLRTAIAMTLPQATPTLTSPIEADQNAILKARLARTQETLANQFISRRLDQDRIAVLELEVQDLRETIAGLRRALEAARPGHRGHRHRGRER